MAKAASPKRAAKKTAAAPAPQIPNRERPAEPERYEAGKDELLEFYRQMLLIRRFEERAGQLYGLGLIGGFCHLYIGQEAVAVGLQSALDRRQGQRHHRLSRPWPHARLRDRSQGDHGRADRARRRHLQGQGRLDAHVQRRAWLLRRPRHRRRAGQPRHRPRLQAQICGAMAASASPISATARPIRARSMRASTWPSCGSCRSSS